MININNSDSTISEASKRGLPECSQNHTALMDQVFGEIRKTVRDESGNAVGVGTRTSICNKCGTQMIVEAQTMGGWQYQEFRPTQWKEIK